jgi:ribokinase
VDAKGEKQILTAPGANHKLTLAECEKAAPMIRDCRVLLVQFETPMRVILRAVELGHKAGAMVVLDPAPPRKVSKRLLSCVDVIRPNSTEAKALTGVEVVDRKSALRAARGLFTAGVRRAAAIQAGSQGDLLIARETTDDPILLPRIKVKTIDETGAGDAFAAGLAVALAWGQPHSVAGPFASVAAALATTKFGAQPAMPRLREVLGLMRRNGFAEAAEALRDKAGVTRR